MTHDDDDEATTPLLHTHDSRRARQVLALLDAEGIVATASVLDPPGLLDPHVEVAIRVKTDDLEHARELLAAFDETAPELLELEAASTSEDREAPDRAAPPTRSRWSITGFAITFAVVFGFWRFTTFLEEGHDVRELFYTCSYARAGSERALDSMVRFARETNDATALTLALAIRDDRELPVGTRSVMSDASWERWENVKRAFRLEANVCGRPGRLRTVRIDW